MICPLCGCDMMQRVHNYTILLNGADTDEAYRLAFRNTGISDINKFYVCTKCPYSMRLSLMKVR